MSDDEKLKALGAKVQLLADLKLRAEQRLESAETELQVLRVEKSNLLKALGQMRKALEKQADAAEKES